MTYRNGCVFMEEKHSHGFSDDYTSTDDNCLFPFHLHVIFFREFDNTSGGAGCHAAFSYEEFSQVGGMEAVDIFYRIDRFSDFVESDMRWQGLLNEYSVDIDIIIQ